MNSTLTNERGKELQRGAYGINFSKGATYFVFSYSTGELDTSPSSLKLRLTIDGLYPTGSGFGPPPVNTPTPGPSPTSAPTRPVISGQLEFELVVPFYPAKTTEPNQIARATDGSEVTLTKVIVTPIQMRAYLSGLKGLVQVDFAVNGWDSASEFVSEQGGDINAPPGTIGFIVYTAPPLDKQAGEWLLTVRPVMLPRTASPDDTPPPPTLPPTAGPSPTPNRTPLPLPPALVTFAFRLD